MYRIYIRAPAFVKPGAAPRAVRCRGAMPLPGGFHGLRPLNDGEFGAPRPLSGAPPAPLSTSTAAPPHRSSTLTRHSEGAQRPKNPTVGCVRVTTQVLKICCHSRAPRGNPTVGSTGVATQVLKICCHSEGAKRPKNPPDGSTMVTTTYCLAPDGGIPASRG